MTRGTEDHDRVIVLGGSMSRRDFLRLGGAGLAGATLLGVAGCGSGGSASQGGEGKAVEEIRLGITQNNVGVDSYQTTYENAFTKACNNRGLKNPSILDAGGDVARQVSQMQDLITQQMDVIVIWPTQGKAVVPALKNADAQGIPVVVTNSKIDESGYQYMASFSGPDNVRQGQYAAEMMTEALGGSGKILEIRGQPGYTTAIERSKGFTDAMKNESGIEIIDSQPGNWSRAKAQEVMENFLTKYNDVDGVYAADDNMGVGALNAIKSAGRLKNPDGSMAIHLVGATCFAVGYDAIKAGEYYGSVYQSPIEDAKNALDTAIRVVQGKDVPKFNYFETPKITQDNLEEFDRPAF